MAGKALQPVSGSPIRASSIKGRAIEGGTRAFSPQTVAVAGAAIRCVSRACDARSGSIQWRMSLAPAKARSCAGANRSSRKRPAPLIARVHHFAIANVREVGRCLGSEVSRCGHAHRASSAPIAAHPHRWCGPVPRETARPCSGAPTRSRDSNAKRQEKPSKPQTSVRNVSTRIMTQSLIAAVAFYPRLCFIP